MADITKLELVRPFDKRKLNIYDWLRDDGITYSDTYDGSSVVTVTLDDPRWDVLASGFFDRNEDAALDTIELFFDNEWYRLCQVNPEDDLLSLTFELRIVAKLRNKFGHRVASRNKMTRAEFARSLVKSVKSEKIGFFTRELHDKQPIAESDQERVAEVKRKPSGAGKGVEVGAFLSTAYGPPWNAMNGTGTTAGGTNLHDGKRRYIVAADKSVLPLGTHVYIDPNPYDYDGTFLVDDTGGAINGNRLDFYIAEGRAKQLAWGRQRVKVWKGSKGGKDGTGSDPGGQMVSRAVSYQYEVEKNEDYWTALNRLADEVNWRVFAHRGVVYFMDDYQLLRSKPVYTLKRDSTDVLSLGLEWDSRASFPQEMHGTLFVSHRKLTPGDTVDAVGAGPANGRWIVSEASGSWFEPTVNITLVQPQVPKKEPAHEVTTSAGEISSADIPESVSANGGAKALVDSAAKIAAEFGTYVASAARGKNSVTTSGNISDHSQNDSSRAARDIAVAGIDAIVGPPSPKLDRAVVAIGKAFGRQYKTGQVIDADTFSYKGFRVQIIWRTPKYGGHMGHIHIGARKE